jgi:8-oxo-dGTP pyrophosphatase MutT (NUDIX family)
MITLLLIVKNNKYLFFKRVANVLSPGGRLGLIGGRVGSDETPEDGLMRNVKEQTGLDIVDFTFFKDYTFKNIPFKLYIHDNPNFDETQINVDFGDETYQYLDYYDVEISDNFLPLSSVFVTDYMSSQ